MLDHLPSHCLSADKRACGIHVDDLSPLRDGHLQRVHAAHDADKAHQDIDRAEPAYRFFYAGLNGIFQCDVHGVGTDHSIGVFRSQSCDFLLATCRIDVEYH